MLRLLCLALALIAALPIATAPLRAGEFDDIVRVELRPGWRRDDGTHIAALHLTLAPGWKTYWRAPGDAGIPPEFGWRGSRNLAGVSVIWPRPDVFDQAGMRSIGYMNELVLPLAIRPSGDGDVVLKGDMQLGICKDVCLPHALSFSGRLPEAGTARDPRIAAALSDRPFTADEIGGARIRCEIAPGANGALSLTARIDMASAGAREDVVVETGNPFLWVAEPESRREGDTLIASTRIVHMERKPFALDRGALTFTVLGTQHAVELSGCSG
ncbi:Thiol-disulfide interchange protein, contains DsbC and DsbD domains [Roseivivax lentus]|uniref:Thiol-disulfide interchange protein, contains DsbC and DsbD domains n=1 Tax=Roseivivax lentus TaxID=633194 RepID=A0A1N7KAL0_9RHOB|nr:protein-disulfide reductase DsbD domain-containing protein [Roseivivax lentus]SIS58592.1 Thiol-disulfide interchange protein, contains DsbC and DsbD domains [Roseivivax lentus]